MKLEFVRSPDGRWWQCQVSGCGYNGRTRSHAERHADDRHGCRPGDIDFVLAGSSVCTPQGPEPGWLDAVRGDVEEALAAARLEGRLGALAEAEALLEDALDALVGADIGGDPNPVETLRVVLEGLKPLARLLKEGS